MKLTEMADEVLLSTGLVVLGATGVIFASIRTGVEDLDRLGIRLRIAAYALLEFGPKALANDFAIPRALISICQQESGGAVAPVVGDQDAAAGPSIGPMQVYRGTAVDLGLWTPPDDGSSPFEAYEAMASDEGWCIHAGVKVFKNKLAAAGGDVEDAIRRYNGGGDSAAQYQSSVLSWAQGLGWAL